MTFRELLPGLYAFAFIVCGSRNEAFRHIHDLLREIAGDPTILSAARPAEAVLGHLVRHLEESLGRKAETSFVVLDNLLRSEESQVIDASKSPIDGDLSRIPVLLWELKRTCLAAVLGCLPPGVRLSFVMTDVLGVPPPAAAELLGIRESAFRVRLTRARRRLGDFLGPRCGHLDRHNPCNCEGRLNLALQAGFVELPPHTADTPAAAYDEDGHPDAAGLYGSLPPVRLTEAQLAALLLLEGKGGI